MQKAASELCRVRVPSEQREEKRKRRGRSSPDWRGEEEQWEISPATTLQGAWDLTVLLTRGLTWGHVDPHMDT